jgi:hypothetical protein
MLSGNDGSVRRATSQLISMSPQRLRRRFFLASTELQVETGGSLLQSGSFGSFVALLDCFNSRYFFGSFLLEKHLSEQVSHNKRPALKKTLQRKYFKEIIAICCVSSTERLLLLRLHRGKSK